MANSINATSTGNGGIITTGDDSGVLNIQTNETTAISIDASQNATFTNGANLPNTFGFKNRIINGGMVIDQRRNGTALTPAANGDFIVDRFFFSATQASKFYGGQNYNSVTPPAGFKYYAGVQCSTAYSVASSDFFGLTHRIEGFNVADLEWGTANALSVTLSFKVYSSLTGTFGGSLQNNAGNRSYPFSYTITTANTWTTVSVTVPGDTTGTWLTTNGSGLQVFFALGAGSTYSGTAGSWAGAAYLSATGAVSVVGTQFATFYVTGVQLEKGTQATSFDFRSIGTELALCQRYYTSSGTAYSDVCNTAAYASLPFGTFMRATPTVTLTPTAGTMTAAGIGTRGCYVNASTTNAFGFTASAEL